MKSRNETVELKSLRSLHARMDLSAKDKNYYINLEKGYLGERKFDIWIEPISKDWIVLNDLLFESNNTLFQIDSLGISSNTIYIFEIKNYEGDYYVDGDRWFSLTGVEIKNPLHQLKRNETLFRRLLQHLGFTFSIESYLIFINPEFQLYQTPLNLPIIFPTQLNRFIDRISQTPSKLKDLHTKVANQLLSMHLNDSPYLRLPDYHYDSLKKGIVCPSCYSLYTLFAKKIFICHSCGGREEYQPAVLRSIEEFRRLFPDRQVTTNTIYEWCEIIKAKKTIRQILMDNFNSIGHGKSYHYVD